MQEVDSSQNGKLIERLQSKPLRERAELLAMRVGERMHLELLAAGDRFWAELIGFKQGAFLIALLPGSVAQPKIFKKDETIIVRMLNKDFQLCGFQASILKMETTPYPLLFIKFPLEYEKYHLRRNERVNCYLPATLIYDGREFSSTVINISLGGARLVLDPLGLDINPKQLARQEAFLLATARDPNKEFCTKLFVLSTEMNEELIMVRTEFIEFIGDSRIILQEFISWVLKNTPQDHHSSS